MHSYGNWPDEYFGDVDNAAWWIGERLARWGRISVSTTKEKFGTARVYCHFGWSSLYSIWRPRHVWIPKWYPYGLDLNIFKYVSPILNRIAVPIQKSVYRYFYRRAVARWPHIYWEILHGADYPKILHGHMPGYNRVDWKGVGNEDTD